MQNKTVKQQFHQKKKIENCVSLVETGRPPPIPVLMYAFIVR